MRSLKTCYEMIDLCNDRRNFLENLQVLQVNDHIHVDLMGLIFCRKRLKTPDLSRASRSLILLLYNFVNESRMNHKESENISLAKSR